MIFFSVSPAFIRYGICEVFSSGDFLNSSICSRRHIQICLTDQFTMSIFCDFTNNFFIQTLLARLCWQHTRVNVWQGRCNGVCFFFSFFFFEEWLMLWFVFDFYLRMIKNCKQTVFQSEFFLLEEVQFKYDPSATENKYSMRYLIENEAAYKAEPSLFLPCLVIITNAASCTNILFILMSYLLVFW